MIEKDELKVKPKFQIAENFLDLKAVKENVIISHLEEQIKMRDMSAEKMISKRIRKLP